MSERHTVTMNADGHPAEWSPVRELARPRYAARGSVTVDHAGIADEVVVEVGLGDDESKDAVLTMERPGRFLIPSVIPANERVAVRCRGRSARRPVTITLELEPAGASSSER
jgi:hypothetical protein